MSTTFQTQDFASIVAGMINHARGTQSKITDFIPGSKARTILEAAGIQLDEFYQQLLNGLLAAIPTSTFQSFNFPPLPAVAAGGSLNIVVQSSVSALVIPAGTIFTPAGLSVTYASVSAVTIAAGQTTGQVSVTCTQTGTGGNIAVDQSFTAQPNPIGFVSASNPAAFSNGQPAETPAQQIVRFAAYVQSLQRCNDAGIAYGLSQVALTDSSGNVTEKVAFVYVDDPTPAPGAAPGPFTVYVHNGIGNTSAQLVAKCQQVVNGYVNSAGTKVAGYKAAGVPCTVYGAMDSVLNVGGALTVLPGYVESSLAALANAAVANYIQSLAPGEKYVQAQAYALVMAISGVYDWVPTSPGDQTIAATSKFIPGTMSIA